MVMPAYPVADLVVGKARFSLATLNTFLDAVFGFRYATEFCERCFQFSVAQIVIRFDYRTVTISVSNDNQQFPARCF